MKERLLKGGLKKKRRGLAKGYRSKAKEHEPGQRTKDKEKKRVKTLIFAGMGRQIDL